MITVTFLWITYSHNGSKLFVMEAWTKKINNNINNIYIYIYIHTHTHLYYLFFWSRLPLQKVIDNIYQSPGRLWAYNVVVFIFINVCSYNAGIPKLFLSAGPLKI